MGNNKVFLSACVSGIITMLGLIYFLIANVFYKRRGGKAGGTKELLFLHTICIMNMMFRVWAWDTGVSPLLRYVLNTLLWWCYRFAVQWIYYCRFCAVNLGSIQAPWIQIILRAFLLYPLLSVILRLTRFDCTKEEGGYCAPYQKISIYWSLPSLILVDLAYFVGFVILMRRFEALSLRVSQEDEPKTRKILSRNLKQCLVTNVLTAINIGFYCAMQENYLSTVVASNSIEMLLINGVLVMIYQDWRLRLWPWGRDRFALRGYVQFPLVNKELSTVSEAD